MFLAKAGKLRGLGRFGDYTNRSPMYKIDDWVGASSAGAAMAPTAQIVPGVSNTTTAAIGIGGLAAAAALAYYLMK